MRCGEKAIGKAIQSAGRDTAPVDHDKPRQVFAFLAQSIGCPGAHAGAPLQAGSAMEEVVGRGMLRKIRGHRAHDAELVGHRSHVWEEVADPGATLAPLTEPPRRLHDLANVFKLGFLQFANGCAGVLAMVLFKHRLVIERVHL